ncbi:long-chain-fatty-acid--CoA ligase FadD15 [Variibacter gotjawalensis]|uniref:Long-chain-fatty-acid--CoA ligase FadD15 n=1 Tax=Variibacter gotjawalensis TaxID=1333996 RepID=A0A0S3PVJ1_9BRAD|nr:AMP-binding protein [Variibacter gotjawalensis]NIK45784.1 long-chain acyl-CoA synthetase [Variibacter gotjawalensis]RZS47708.1 long-chain acyl-CoA synthetase [Variibacter gotjawalensis]BAT59961.1 long-chain-fatty-acid--CoA ligase FadD15 [Variibacter gotjawalensis]
MAINAGKEDTFPKLLLRNAARWGSRPAIRHKDLGIWQAWTWGEALDHVRAFSIGLESLGFKRGDKLAIIGYNRPKLYWGMAAAQALGGVPVPLYADSVADEMAYVLEHSEAEIALVQNQEQVDKVLSISDRLTRLTTIIYDEPRGLRDYDHSRLKSFEDVEKIGRDILARDPQAAEKWLGTIAQGKGSDLGIMLYTSGTTGRPKGVMLTQDNILISAANGNAFDKLDENEEVIAYLPLAWVGDHIFSYAQSYTAGFCVSCPESPETVVEDRREIGTTYAFAPPRVYENILTLTMVRMQDASKMKLRMFDYFIEHARKYGEKILNGESVPLGARLKYWLGNILVYAPLKNRFGLSRVRVGYTAGEAIGPEIFRFFRSLGINLKQLYGQTEASVYITAQPDGEILADTVGKPNIDVDIRIADNGEVQFRSPGVFQGYFKEPEKTAETKTEDGWVRTGDAGFIDPKTGHLKIIDRAKDVGKLANGNLFAPKYIENKLKFYPNIKEAVAFGDARDFVTVMLNIDLTAVGSWAERNNVVYGSYQELANHPLVYQMIEKHVDEVNASLATEPMMAGAQVKRFLILPKELEADDGELTRTQKVRRGFIGERYEPLVTALYNGSHNAHISTEVTFEDGRKGKIEADVKVSDVKIVPAAAAMEKAA